MKPERRINSHEFVNTMLTVWSEHLAAVDDATDEKKEIMKNRTGRHNSLDILKKNPRLQDYFDSRAGEQRLPAELLADLICECGEYKNKKKSKKSIQQTLNNWLNSGIGYKSVNMISRDTGVASPEQWIDFFSALEETLCFFSGVRVNTDSDEYEKIEDPSFENFLNTYQYILRRLDYKMLIPVYIRSVDDIATAVAIYLGGGYPLKESLVALMQEAMKKGTATTGKAVPGTKDLNTIFVECIKEVFNNLEKEPKTVEERQCVKNEIEKQLGKFVENYYFSLNIRKHDSIFSTAKEMIEKTATVSFVRNSDDQESIISIEQGVVDKIQTVEFPRRTGNVSVNLNGETASRQEDKKESLWDFNTKRFHRFLRDQLITRIFATFEGGIQHECQLHRTHFQFVTDQIQQSLRRFSKDEDKELLARLMLLRMRLILWLCFDASAFSTPDEVICRINLTLNDVGFSELAFAGSGKGIENFVKNDNVFDWVICESLHRMLDHNKR